MAGWSSDVLERLGSRLAGFHDTFVQRSSAETGLLRVLESPTTIDRVMPRLLLDFSGGNQTPALSKQQTIHGSYLVRHHDVLLFGPNNLITAEGSWSSETRGEEGYILPYYNEPFYDQFFPGPKPKVEVLQPSGKITMSHLKADDVICIEDPVFLATPLEPSIWGRWVTTVLPKVFHYQTFGSGRKLLCFVESLWQRMFLNHLGVLDDQIVEHDVGRTYLCEDLMTVEFSDLALSISANERAHLSTIVEKLAACVPEQPRLFVSRIARSKQNPIYRMLLNEEELKHAMQEMGFITIEPEFFPIPEQIAMFSKAREVVFVGGSSVYNAAFCSQAAQVMTLESTGIFLPTHAGLFSSLGLQHGLVIGREDASDDSLSHRRWTVDVESVCDAVRIFGRHGNR